MYDRDLGEVVPEVLLMDGCELPATAIVPVPKVDVPSWPDMTASPNAQVLWVNHTRDVVIQLLAFTLPITEEASR